MWHLRLKIFDAFWTNRSQRLKCDTGGSGNGRVVERQVKIPTNAALSDHTILSWRWDSQQTDEVFASCADVEIVDTP